MNNKETSKIHSILTTCLDSAGIEPEQTHAPTIKKHPQSTCYYVDLCVEDCNEEQLAYLVGYLVEFIGMKNIWFDSYPKSNRVHLELVFPVEATKRMIVVTH